MKSRILIIGLLMMQAFTAVADPQLFMLRSTQAFPEAMTLLQDAINKQGYTVTRVQHVDKGLTTMGFKTDLYRVVFFAKTDELHQLSEQHPELIPYLPLQIAIFAEADETILVASNPLNLTGFYPNAGLTSIFGHWHDDLADIFQAVQNAD